MASKRLTIVATLVVLLLAPHARAGEEFFWGDTILLPRVTVPDDPDRLARCDYIMRGEASRMTFGYVVPIPPKLADGTYPFEVYDGLMGINLPDLLVGETADFDVTFVPELGVCDAPPPSPTRYFTPGNEEGIVPAGTRYAIVTALDSAGATFVIEIGAVS